MSKKIQQIKAREILSTGSFPTIETKVVLDDGTEGVASAPFGSSPGAYEAVTLVDEDPNRYHGLGMLKAVHNVNDKIAPVLTGTDVTEQRKIDQIMRELDGTPQFANLGGNAILSVSLACARAASKSLGQELFQYIRPMFGNVGEEICMPQPMMVLIEGGQHADDSTDLQEYKIICRTKDWPMKEWIREGIEVYQTLRRVLKERGYSVNVGYEGAYAPTAVSNNREPLELITEAITRTGYEPGVDVGLAMDPAASEIFISNQYVLARENRKLSSDQMIEYYKDLVQEFRIISIEDGLAEDDWDGWCQLMKEMGSEIMVLGDDLTVTNTIRLQKAIDLGAINSILIKPNQAGTLTEVVDTIDLAREHRFTIVVSHRGGGDTTDTFIADLSVAANAEMIKCGASRSERTEKYNRLMEIAEMLEK